MTDTTPKTWTVNAIKDAVRATGSHWFDPDTMRFFGTKVLPTVYQGPGGIFFVTSDHDFQRVRKYTVRQFDPIKAEIDTYGDMAEHDDARTAKRIARIAAGGKEAQEATQEFSPVSVVDQFAHDLQKHTNPDRGTETATVKAAKELIQLARKHHHLMELWCSDETFNRAFDADGNHPRITACRNKIRKIVKDLGCKGVIFSGDPRGSTVKLVFHDGATNDWGKEGYCVPTEAD